MGILDSVIGGILGGGQQGGSASPIGNILSSVLGGGQNDPNQSGGLSGAGTAGGLGGLLSQFENAGLGHIAQSWIGNGPNQPVSPEQLQNVFGHQQVQDMANQAGMDQGDFLSQLSQHLPAAVDNMTPNGQAPDGSMSV